VISIHAHFDGNVIVPDDPVDLPRNQALIVQIEPVNQPDRARDASSLDWLAENAVDSSVLPTDLALEHDHYLYGTNKKDARARDTPVSPTRHSGSHYPAGGTSFMRSPLPGVDT